LVGHKTVLSSAYSQTVDTCTYILLLPVRPPIIRQSLEEKRYHRTTHPRKSHEPSLQDLHLACASPRSTMQQARESRICTYPAGTSRMYTSTSTSYKYMSLVHHYQLYKGTPNRRTRAALRPFSLPSQSLRRADTSYSSRCKARCNLHARLKGPCQASAVGAALS
jgi:hypothetical protein